jgi:hypothetical protein
MNIEADILQNMKHAVEQCLQLVLGQHFEAHS